MYLFSFISPSFSVYFSCTFPPPFLFIFHSLSLHPISLHIPNALFPHPGFSLFCPPFLNLLHPSYPSSRTLAALGTPHVFHFLPQACSLSLSHCRSAPVLSFSLYIYLRCVEWTGAAGCPTIVFAPCHLHKLLSYFLQAVLFSRFVPSSVCLCLGVCFGVLRG